MSLQIFSLQPQAPFSLSQTVAFLRRFPPCQGEYHLAGDGASLRGAVMVEEQGVAFEVRQREHLEIVLESTSSNPAIMQRAGALARAFLGADDSLEDFYDAAARDVAPFRKVVRSLYGLHHVRFLTLAETTVHSVLMQRTPIVLAARQKRAILHAFGRGVGDRIAFPSFERLLGLGEMDFFRVLRHSKKASMLPGVVRSVAALGEDFLRTAPYADAVAALRAIPGIGPFSAAFILLRGLGRMDEVPLEMPSFTQPAERVYGSSFDPQRIRALYGTQLGYWAFYVRTFHA